MTSIAAELRRPRPGDSYNRGGTHSGGRVKPYIGRILEGKALYGNSGIEICRQAALTSVTSGSRAVGESFALPPVMVPFMSA